MTDQIMTINQAFAAGFAAAGAVSLVGMMAAFAWATWLERGDRHGVRSYRAMTLMVVATLAAIPFIHLWL